MPNLNRTVRSAACLVAGICALSWSNSNVALAQDQPAATQPATRPAIWFRMSPDEFARSEAAQQELPWGEVDGRLLSAAILHETNRHRAENNLPALRHMPRLDEAALMHAKDMVEGDYFSHVNENDPKKREVIDRVKLLGLNPMFVGENIIVHYGWQYEDDQPVYTIEAGGEERLGRTPNGDMLPPQTYHTFAKAVVQRWMDSPTHRENVLSPHAKFLGSACYPGDAEDEIRFRKFYCVQVFFAPMPR